MQNLDLGKRFIQVALGCRSGHDRTQIGSDIASVLRLHTTRCTAEKQSSEHQRIMSS
jgi:hypothetical protein